ncbi:dnaJ homolog subfamily C member 24 isoform X2 [Engystomops pustulosus]|uniref:dnaJ homolog subfamily C member 24 isoform X2 n=1 Tax=Engystomops pustulosus TaxID=76066 RepID=UPI003AFA5490
MSTAGKIAPFRFNIYLTKQKKTSAKVFQVVGDVRSTINHDHRPRDWYGLVPHTGGTSIGQPGRAQAEVSEAGVINGALTQSFPVDNQIDLEEMMWHEDEEYYSYSCRCGGQYIAGESDLEQTSLVNCDTCSLIIEVLQGSHR